MKVLVIGSGGREHALAWKIARSALVDEVLCAPGNAGIARVARCVPVPVSDRSAIRALVREEGIDLIVIGPEQPLVDGLADQLREDGKLVFGPSGAAAHLEGSKAFAKTFMARHGIPTARFAVFDSFEPLIGHLEGEEGAVVLKADGLAAGKGVILCPTRADAKAAATQIMRDQAFGTAGERVVVEDLLVGEEASYLALVDGERVVPLVSSQDHKALLEGDKGPNTGGMGAYTPAPVVDPEMEQRILDEIMRPTVRGMALEGRPFQGLLYAGLMITDEGPQVLEFNVRFGDPETQPLMVHLDEDLVPLLVASGSGSLEERPLRWREGTSCCVVLASSGYPGSYDKGLPIQGLDDLAEGDDLVVFHAGTATDDDGATVTSGGRVLGVTAHGLDIEAARENVYDAVESIRWTGMIYRRDIGHRALRRHREGTGS